MNINNDLEAQRLHRNHTNTQRKQVNLVREGTLINQNRPLSDSYNTMVISESASLPQQLYEKTSKDKNFLLPTCLTTVGTMGVLAGITHLFAKSAKDTINVDLAKKLPSLTRNVCINEEINQAIYRMVASPSKKATHAALGVAILSVMGFIGKIFCDGFKDVWVKRKEANIQKQLQENLIEIETQSFGGKLQINRTLLAQKASEFSEVLSEEPTDSFMGVDLAMKNQIKYKMFSPSFGAKNKKSQKSDFKDTLGNIVLGLASLSVIIGFGYLSVKNIRKSSEYMKQGVAKVKESINAIIEQMNTHTQEKLGKEVYNASHDLNQSNIRNLLVSIDASADEVIQTADKIHWTNSVDKQDFIKQTIFNIKKSTERANSALGGSGEDRNTFYSHVSDYTAFFYNWLLDSSNKQFKNLFLGVTGVAATSYLGKTLFNAIKDVQVKKYNADTELELQKKLVSTELKNFKSKKESSIEPLCEEFYRQKSQGKSKEELKIIADSILNEIKNGAPYVYS